MTNTIRKETQNRINVIEEPGGNRIRRMKIKAQQKIRVTGIFVSKGLFRSNVSLLKTQPHQRMKYNTIKLSLTVNHIIIF